MGFGPKILPIPDRNIIGSFKFDSSSIFKFIMTDKKSVTKFSNNVTIMPSVAFANLFLQTGILYIIYI